ncbi:MAG: EamA family transporter [Clostridia bacterium]|nr:EamA family transporter [Clostridia bacterium]
MKRARLMLISSMVIFGTVGLFKRFIPVSSGELALYRAILGALLLGGVLLVTRQRIPLRTIRRQLPLLLLSGAAMGVNWILLFEAYENTSIALGTISYYFAPVIVMAACPLLFREKMTGRQIICFLLSVLGMVLITCLGAPEEAAGERNDLLGILLGLGAAVFYATVMLLNKFIRGVEGLHRTLLQFLAAIVTLLPYVALTGGMSLSGMDAKGWLCLLVVGLVHTGLAYVMYFPSLKELPGQKAAILSYIDPLVAVLISAFALQEAPLTWGQLIGAVLLLGATLWNELTPKEKEPTKIKA